MTKEILNNIGVVGCGAMGAGIAQVMLQGGLTVIVNESDGNFLEKGMSSISAGLEYLEKKGKISSRQKAELLSRLTGTIDLGGMKDCDLVIEAVFENEDVKLDLFSKLDSICGKETIFASNTSSMSITKLAAATSRPDRLLGMHFFNPVPVMKLVEVVKTLSTRQETIDKVLRLAKTIGKKAVVAKDDAGFIVNALTTPYMLDAMRAVSNNAATVQDIDNAIRYGTNHPLGPLMLSDLIGLDILYGGTQIMFEEKKDTRFAPPSVLKKMVMMNCLGKKTGKGFYDWSDPRNPKPVKMNF
ncbi:MAG: 3-hydroxyacyl-CoA dehydrogenase family protein [Desulfobacula sp.]|nr:3-hydroxyacyl-CoA dehydrogenase family protein [Desulfobacula sp.]